MRLSAWGYSDPGRKRERNEDSYLVDPETGVIAVADGMGGHQGGATASRMAVEYLGRELASANGNFEKALFEQLEFTDRVTEPMIAATPSASTSLPKQLAANVATSNTVPPTPPPTFHLPAALELMKRISRKASAAIYEAALLKPELRGMGTTLTAVFVHEGRAHLVHAGDSRCYMFRDGQLRQLTDDHSWIADQIRSGAITESEAKSSKFRHVITKSIGFEREIAADTRTVPVSAGDCFVLCSDGMSNYVEHGELERIIAMTWYRRLPTTLVELANSRGGEDNITVVVGLVSNAPAGG